MDVDRSLLSVEGRVLVAVGATSGIGRGIAAGLARLGATVIPTGRRAELVEAACDEVEACGRSTVRATTDVTNRVSIDRLRDVVIAEFGRVDGVINCAGYTHRSPVAMLSEADWSSVIDTNLTGALRVCQSFLEPLKESGRGRIVNVASLAAFVSYRSNAAYGAAKAGLHSLTQMLALEWADVGICVNSIAPGVVVTELTRTSVVGTERGAGYLARIPLNRFGTVTDLVGPVAMLMSDASSYLTGQCLVVDGGFLICASNDRS